MTPEFHRIRRLPPYVLEEVNRIKARLRAQGTDIIDFGMGNPDMPTPKHIVDKLIETARDPKAGRYSASKGIIGLRMGERRGQAQQQQDHQATHAGSPRQRRHNSRGARGSMPSNSRVCIAEMRRLSRNMRKWDKPFAG